MNRITQHPVLEVKSRQEVGFTFDGIAYKGFENEPVSSALFANGIKEFSIHKKDDAPQGIFCANGQCSQCTVIINGMPFKSCVTPLKQDMDIITLRHVPELPHDDNADFDQKIEVIKTAVLIIGGGPSGLTSALELAELGFNIVIVEDKDKLGGKLLLQTHKFFGSQEDSYAGMRGFEIAELLESKILKNKNITVLYESSIVGVYKDKKAGVYKNNGKYSLIDFEGMIVSAGAREKSLVFQGNDLSGVYGAGAFQTLVNRDMIKSSDKVFIVGSGNVGLIAAYHALQAGIGVVGIIDIMDNVSGYKVHADKIRRMGVPIHLKTTILAAFGHEKVEKVTIAEVDDNWNPLLETAKTYETDTLLIATGLTPADEFYDTADRFGFKVIKTGDTDEIAEASSAMFGGRIAGLKMAKLLGKDIDIDPSFYEKSEILKSKPGEVFNPKTIVIKENFTPIFQCFQEIPCDPCVTVCPKGCISLKGKFGNILDIPEYTVDECSNCGLCVAVCPGLAVSLARKIDEETAEVILPHEYILNFITGDKIDITDIDGEILEKAEVIHTKFNKKYKTHLITVKMSLKNAHKAIGIRMQDKKITEHYHDTLLNFLPENGIVCRCERVSVKEIIDFIREFKVRDINQLKQIRVGMGACGSKTCSILLPKIFKQAGIDFTKVSLGTLRPLTVEVPMNSLIDKQGN
ncbi:MAG: FAD-dependent oxidoreductase [Candidatus Delongbacteria bacterium]|nr:FAD-dependent oxidoreductase [Candidatus Delongbacteria bacterium]MCG2761219.1 FAD-dependent oxidoreductase [Candidatus Delongbacteria bacterium]